MKQKNQYSYQDLLDCAEGKMFGPGNAKLPASPMLMFDRITSITAEGGFGAPALGALGTNVFHDNCHMMIMHFMMVYYTLMY